MRDGDQADPVVEHAGERADVDLAGVGARHDLDHRAGALRDLEHRDEVAGVLGSVREDPVAGGERHRVEDLVPGPGRALGERDLGCRSTDESRDGIRRRGDLVGGRSAAS